MHILESNIGVITDKIFSRCAQYSADWITSVTPLRNAVRDLSYILWFTQQCTGFFTMENSSWHRSGPCWTWYSEIQRATGKYFLNDESFNPTYDNVVRNFLTIYGQYHSSSCNLFLLVGRSISSDPMWTTHPVEPYFSLTKHYIINISRDALRALDSSTIGDIAWATLSQQMMHTVPSSVILNSDNVIKLLFCWFPLCIGVVFWFFSVMEASLKYFRPPIIFAVRGEGNCTVL